jgi:hypothetical protein
MAFRRPTVRSCSAPLNHSVFFRRVQSRSCTFPLFSRYPRARWRRAKSGSARIDRGPRVLARVRPSSIQPRDRNTAVTRERLHSCLPQPPDLPRIYCEIRGVRLAEIAVTPGSGELAAAHRKPPQLFPLWFAQCSFRQSVSRAARYAWRIAPQAQRTAVEGLGCYFLKSSGGWKIPMARPRPPGRGPPQAGSVRALPPG